MVQYITKIILPYVEAAQLSPMSLCMAAVKRNQWNTIFGFVQVGIPSSIDQVVMEKKLSQDFLMMNLMMLKN